MRVYHSALGDTTVLLGGTTALLGDTTALWTMCTRLPLTRLVYNHRARHCLLRAVVLVVVREPDARACMDDSES